MSLSSTLVAARGGSPQALGTLLASCQNYLRAIATRQLPRGLRGRVRPSSLVQETYLRACRHFGDFQGQSERQLLAWLRQILLHCLANTIRRPEFRTLAGQLLADPESRGATPDQEAAAIEGARDVSAALNRLPTHYRLAIELRHFERLSFEEIGQVLDCSGEAARKVWARAQAKLGAELRPQQ